MMSIIEDTEEGGSVLIETLAALAIISTAVVMGLHGFAEAAARLKRAEEQMTALTLAQNLIAETLGTATTVPADRHGISDTGFHWSIKVHRELVHARHFLARPYGLTVTVARAGGPPLVVETTAIALDRE
jgi:type II secretory pathway pseudopilin PulG